MPRDGADMNQTTLLPDLLTLTADAVPAARALLDRATEAVRALVSEGDRVSAAKLEANQTAAHALSWYATYAEALTQMQGWAYAVLDNPRLSPFLINAQLYGWNEFFARDLIANYGARLPGSAPIWRALARRLIVAQVFLHSDHSHGIALSPSEDGRLNAVQMTNAATGDIMASAARAYADGFAKAGLVALPFALRHGQVGASFHLGGSLAMSDAPRGAQTDMLGQVPGLHRVHVVDASVLPSIAATTITMTVMANAHRIASEVD